MHLPSAIIALCLCAATALSTCQLLNVATAVVGDGVDDLTCVIHHHRSSRCPTLCTHFTAPHNGRSDPTAHWRLLSLLRRPLQSVVSSSSLVQPGRAGTVARLLLPWTVTTASVVPEHSPSTPVFLFLPLFSAASRLCPPPAFHWSRLPSLAPPPGTSALCVPAVSKCEGAGVSALSCVLSCPLSSSQQRGVFFCSLHLEHITVGWCRSGAADIVTAS